MWELVAGQAVLTVQGRSTTVTANGDVQALRIDAHDFAAFLEGRPRLWAVIEQQVYWRQTERRVPPVMLQGGLGNCLILITDGHRVLNRLMHQAETTGPGQVAELADRAGAAVGLRQATIYLTDLRRELLVPVPGSVAARQQSLPIDDSVPG
ncbi:hypothetical protein HUT06_21295 [Actinomadura sp. NAK00032]|uniref:hypothetical protein n=1 Tax=Actinomadura sp. NAK00032 TaxID=2742128 RepID=UPI00159216DE|nr:hypothetical protein [Actinomadura sp. NAK00032]QKW36256.1 hypothetical protein HUT06_21295 [Actinomadura sp. NAK00032]